MKRDPTHDTLPNPPEVDRTDPGSVPRFEAGDPTPPPTEAEAREAGRLLAGVKRAPRVVVRVGERPAEGAPPAAPGTLEHRERVQRELGDLARSARPTLQPTGAGRDDPTIPPVVRRAQRRTWVVSGFAIVLAACGVVAIALAFRQPAPPLASSSSASAPASPPTVAHSSVVHDPPQASTGVATPPPASSPPPPTSASAATPPPPPAPRPEASSQTTRTAPPTPAAQSTADHHPLRLPDSL